MGFLVKEGLASGIELIKDGVIKKARRLISKEREAGILCFSVVFTTMPTDSENVSFIESSYSAMKEHVLCMKERGQVVLVVYFNTRVGKSFELDDVMVKENVMQW